MFAIRQASSKDRDDICMLIAEMIPGVDVEARWRWLYETNPGGRAITWLATENGVVAGCTSFFPFRLWLDRTPVLAALGGDGFVRPTFRRRGLGGLLHDASRAAMTALGIACMYGAPGAMNVTPLKHGGSRELGHVVRWARPLRGAAFGITSSMLDGAIGLLLKPHTSTRLVSMMPHDSRVDEVWSAARTELRLAAVRDAAFYTWRFLESPAQQEPAFLIVDGEERPIGACSLEPMHDDRTIRIVDLIATPSKWHACLRAIARHAAEHTRARTLVIKLFALDGRKRMMLRSGFTEREQKPFLCMIPPGGDRRFLDPDRWFYCGADSDLDRLD